LLDEAKVEARSIGNGLKVVGDGTVRIQDEVVIIEWNGWVLPLGEIRDGLFESAAEIRVSGGAAIARPPTCVYRQLLEVGEPPLLWDPGYLAGRQNGETAQVDWLCAL